MSSVSLVFDVLKNNSDFVKNVDESIKKILKDDKIDFGDIPEIIYVITHSYNAYTTIKISQEDLPTFIKLIVEEIIKKKNLIPQDKMTDFDKYVDTALKLVMIQPRIHDKVESCFNCLSCLPCFTADKYSCKK